MRFKVMFELWVKYEYFDNLISILEERIKKYKQKKMMILEEIETLF